MPGSLLIVTTSRPDAERAADGLRALGIAVGVLEVRELLFTPPDQLERVVGKEAPKYDLVVVPGTYPYDLSGLGGRYVKGPEGLWLLLDVITSFGVDVLSPSLPFEKANPDLVEAIARRRLSEMRSRSSPIPASPPPISVLSEVLISDKGVDDEVIVRAEALVADGADYIVLAPVRGGLEQVAARVADELRTRLPGVRLGLDSDLGSLARLSDRFEILLSVPARAASSGLGWVQSRELVITVGPEDEKYVEAALREAERWGVRPVLDPIALPTPSPGLVGTIERLRYLAGFRAPKMIGLSNVVELMDADTSGSAALLTSLAAELGVSALLVEEASPKARGLTAEARAAADMVSLALLWGKSAKDLGVSLLNSKLKAPQASMGGVKVREVGSSGAELELRDGTKIQVDCRDPCPLERLAPAQDPVVASFAAVLLYRACLPWSSGWRC